MSVVFYHNPKCSKSRAVSNILEGLELEFTTIEYLRTGFTRDTLKTVIDALQGPATQLVRTNNDTFRDLGLDADKLDAEQVIEILLQHPQLFQRPVVLAKGEARIGRPPDSVLEIL